MGEAPELIDHDFRTIGFSFRCPRCGISKTYYSSKHQSWVCPECGLVFIPLVTTPQEPLNLPIAATCEFCDDPAVTTAPTRLGYEALMCRKHWRLYEAG